MAAQNQLAIAEYLEIHLSIASTRLAAQQRTPAQYIESFRTMHIT